MVSHVSLLHAPRISLYFLLQKISLKMPADKTLVKPEAGFEK